MSNCSDWDALAAADFFSRADKLARAFCKTHPNADRELVHYAAMNAADNYERSAKLRKQRLDNVVRMYICTELLKAKQKRKEVEDMGRNRYTDEDKAEWLSLYTGGATLAEIAEKYGCSQQYVSKCIKFQKEKPPETKENISGDTEEHDYPENILSQPNEDVNYSVEEQRDPEKMPDKPTLDGLVISIRKILGDNVTGVLNFTVSGKKYGLRLK